jgi:hypothetical protein
MKLILLVTFLALIAFISCATKTNSPLECKTKPSCSAGSYVKAKWNSLYSLKGSQLVCGTLDYCNKNGVYSYCSKKSRTEFGVKIEWCDCGTSNTEPSGCHIQLRTASWDGGQQYQCTGTCAAGKKCVATKTVIHEQISSNNANRLADIYCGCAAQYSNY